MVKRRLVMFFCLLAMMAAGTADVHATVERKMTDSQEIPAAGISRIRFKNIFFADLDYTGVADADKFTISFTRTARAGDEEECEALLGELDLDVSTQGDTIDINLKHPEHSTRRIFAQIFKQKEWRVTMKVTGPEGVNVDADASFSSVRVEKTEGGIDTNLAFSSADIHTHTGHFKASGSFSDINARNLDGSFAVSSDFGSVNLSLDRLAENSSARSSFGSVDIRIPRDTGAEFHVKKSMGSANLYLSGDIVDQGEKGSVKILNNGGPLVDLETEFGSLTVRNDIGQSSTQTVKSYDQNAVMPLERKTWWRYTSGEKTSTLTVQKVWVRNNRRIATLSFTGPGEHPFETIDVCETAEGLMIAGINGIFFGKDLSGMSFDPPRLWLPYGDSSDAINGDALFGSAAVKVQEPGKETGSVDARAAVCYTLQTDGPHLYELTLVPGVGFTAFGGDLSLVDYALEGVTVRKSAAVAPKDDTPPPPPPFEKGEIVSVSFSGLRYLPEPDVEKLFPITKGGYYTREDIAGEVGKLSGKNKFINSASYTIDTKGNLKVHIHEAEIFSWDWDADGSFSRVGGLGFGPSLTLKSIVGPFSELSGSTQYHWGNKDWTFGAEINKHFFEHNRLTFGASYRLDYETNMDWAIPKYDSYLNAFLLGLDTTNYYQVEGSSGYVSQRVGQMLELKGEYFEEDYDSLKKHTNWSLFNVRHKKEDNPPLSPGAEGNITGVRVTADIDESYSFFTTGLKLSVERSYDRKVNSLPEYTRYFGNAVYTSRVPYRNLIAIRAAGGWSDDALPEPRAFRLGGLNTLRGFDFGAVPEPPAGFDGFDYHGGGNKMLLANIDYFIGSDDFRMVVFGDVGGVWLKGYDVDMKDLKRDLGVGIVFGGDIFPLENRRSDALLSGFRINWAVPVGPEKHVSHWTVNFVRTY